MGDLLLLLLLLLLPKICTLMIGATPKSRTPFNRIHLGQRGHEATGKATQDTSASCLWFVVVSNAFGTSFRFLFVFGWERGGGGTNLHISYI